MYIDETLNGEGRLLLFRAKPLDSKRQTIQGGNSECDGWTYGLYYKHYPPLQGIVSKDYVPEKPKHYIINTGFADWNMVRPVDFVGIDPRTLSQYTGLKDDEDKPIFEGDVVLFLDCKYIVRFGKCGIDTSGGEYGPRSFMCFYAELWGDSEDVMSLAEMCETHGVLIVGNIYIGTVD